MPATLPDETELRHLHGQQETLLLSLRTAAPQGMAVDPEQQVVALDARRGIAQHALLLRLPGKNLFQRFSVKIRAIGHIHRLAVL